MASTSASRTHGVAGRVRTAATTLYADNQSLLGDFRKAFNVMKDLAVDLETANQFDEVEELKNVVVEFLAMHDDCMHFSSAIQSVGDNYQPPPEPTQLTDFEKLFKNEVTKQKANPSSNAKSQSLIRQFKEAVWKVHHEGQPMPGDEQEDIVMTSTDGNILNTTCPVSGRLVTDLEDPVRSVECKHIYQKKGIMHYLRGGRGRCPIAGCPKLLEPNKLCCDPLLLDDIQELRDQRKNTVVSQVIEDFTELDHED